MAEIKVNSDKLSSKQKIGLARVIAAEAITRVGELTWDVAHREG